jgi:hypothetical protein
MLDEDKLAALNQEWSSPVAEMLVMFRWKSCQQTPRTGMQRDQILFPVYLRDAKRRKRKVTR